MYSVLFKSSILDFLRTMFKSWCLFYVSCSCWFSIVLWVSEGHHRRCQDINQILELPLHAAGVPGQEELTQDNLSGAPRAAATPGTFVVVVVVVVVVVQCCCCCCCGCGLWVRSMALVLPKWHLIFEVGEGNRNASSFGIRFFLYAMFFFGGEGSLRIMSWPNQVANSHHPGCVFGRFCFIHSNRAAEDQIFWRVDHQHLWHSTHGTHTPGFGWLGTRFSNWCDNTLSCQSPFFRSLSNGVC